MIPRFAELGVFVNFTPHWFGGNLIGSMELVESDIGKKRANKMYRANSIWNTGASISFTNDMI